MFLRAENNYDTMEASDQSALHCPEKTKTVQSEKEQSDINTIVRRFGLTGELPNNVRVPQYGDFTQVTDYQTALNVIRQAEEAFMSMPAYVRSRFGNSPEAFVEFCSNPENIDEMRKLGLAVEKEPVGVIQPKVEGQPNGNEAGNPPNG